MRSGLTERQEAMRERMMNKPRYSQASTNRSQRYKGVTSSQWHRLSGDVQSLHTTAATLSGGEEFVITRFFGDRRKPQPQRRDYVFSELRKEVFHRDRGVCVLCGLNTVDLHQALTWVKQRCDVYWEGRLCDPLRFYDFRLAVGLAARRYPRSLWDMDHIVPYSKGRSSELANLRTLCIPCHRNETRRLIHGRTE